MTRRTSAFDSRASRSMRRTSAYGAESTWLPPERLCGCRASSSAAFCARSLNNVLYPSRAAESEGRVLRVESNFGSGVAEDQGGGVDSSAENRLDVRHHHVGPRLGRVHPHDFRRTEHPVRIDRKIKSGGGGGEYDDEGCKALSKPPAAF